ncbi:hypothetical protein EHS25_001170 [Saitozyma podzolica]|uniref:Uncharacterized protein n=1 Tax=Saitozyma podzolica TaxID=1890683 RepID=A0A427YHE6_9TREE|nr:hypothetical protein EHS25_001170 [Saitozyma podzolica]
MEAFEFEGGSVHLQLYVPATLEVPVESECSGEVPSESDPNAEDERSSDIPINMADVVHLRMTLSFQVDQDWLYRPYDGDVVFVASEVAATTDYVEDEDGDSNPTGVAVADEVRLDSLCRLDNHTTPLELMYNPNIGDYEDMDGGRFRWTSTFQPLTADSPFVRSCPKTAGDILKSLIDFTATVGGCFSLRGVEYPSKATLEASVYHDYEPSVAVVWRYRSKDEGTAPDEPTLDVRYQEQPRDDYDAAKGAEDVPQSVRESLQEPVQEPVRELALQEAAGGSVDPEEFPEAVVPVLLRFLRKQDIWTYQGREESG